MRRPAVIFDLDGTLLDTLADLADSANAVLRRHGFPPHPVDAYRYFIGEGVGVLVRRMVPQPYHHEQLLHRLTEAYLAEYAQRWNRKSRPYEGIAELLDALDARQIPKAVLSNKPDAATQQCVAALLGRWRFDAVLGHRDAVPRKPDPTGALQIAARWDLPCAKVLYVGDTATDMQTAAAAGMYPIGALWGFRPDELQTCSPKPMALIHHPTELLDILDALP